MNVPLAVGQTTVCGEVKKMGKGRRVRADRKSDKFGPHSPVARNRAFGTEAWSGHVRLENDRRTTMVLGRCVLCAKESTLRLSHVHPKWAYRWMKNEGGPLISYRADHDASVRMQDGSKHYLLCGGCEQLLGDAENRLRLLSSGSYSELRSANLDVRHSMPGTFEVGAAERGAVLRTLLGICLKAHYSPSISNSIYSNRIVRRLAADLREGKFANYSFFAAKWHGFESGNPRAYCGISFERLSNGSTIATVGIAGFDWWIILDGKVPEELNQIPPWHISIATTRGRKSWFDDWESRIDEPAPIGFTGMSCFCGSYRLFEACCRETWCKWLASPELKLAGTKIAASSNS